jgi:hypothetical protein
MKQSEWSKEEIKEFAKIWETEVGKKYLQKLEEARASWINASLVAETPDQALINARTARGIDLIISDIYAGIAEAKKEEDKKEKK